MDAPRPDRASTEPIRFGDFQLLADQSTLLRHGERVPIGSRALALLTVLAGQPGHYVSNATLIAAAWPTTVVEETNLRVQMTTLRRVLDGGEAGTSYIANAPGRGYALIVPTSFDQLAQPAKAEAATRAAAPIGLAVSLTPLIGRQDAVATLMDRLQGRKLVSLVGPGGIGKTRVASEVCWLLAEDPQLRLLFVDLAPLASGDFVAGAAAATLDLDITELGNPLASIVAALRLRRTVMLFDNCEHVLDATAELVETLLRTLPNLRIITTSREPLLVAANGGVTGGARSGH